MKISKAISILLAVTLIFAAMPVFTAAVAEAESSEPYVVGSLPDLLSALAAAEAGDTIRVSTYGFWLDIDEKLVIPEGVSLTIGADRNDTHINLSAGVDNFGTLTCNGVVNHNEGGKLNNYGALYINELFNNNGCDIYNEGEMTWNETFIFNSGSINNEGSLFCNGHLHFNGSFHNNGLLKINAYDGVARFHTGAMYNGSDAMIIIDQFLYVAAGFNFINFGSLINNNDLQNLGTIINGGTIRVNRNGDFWNGGDLINKSELIIDGIMAIEKSLINYGMLTNNGFIRNLDESVFTNGGSFYNNFSFRNTGVVNNTGSIINTSENDYDNVAGSETNNYGGVIEGVATGITQYYKVTFDANGGSFPENESNILAMWIKEGQLILATPVVEYGNSLFLGWYMGDAAFDFNDAFIGHIELTAKWEERQIVGLKVDASVEKFPGNKNILTITVSKIHPNGFISKTTEVIPIQNNAAGTYIVGEFKVYVDTKGNTQIRECYIVGPA